MTIGSTGKEPEPGSEPGQDKPNQPPLKVERCAWCKVRLRPNNSIVDWTCRCGNRYCLKHRHSYQHNCAYDYKKECPDLASALEPSHNYTPI
ncbi:MAG: AN1-type zinc finger domain-containing protein [Sulfobacillus sp.]